MVTGKNRNSKAKTMAGSLAVLGSLETFSSHWHPHISTLVVEHEASWSWPREASDS